MNAKRWLLWVQSTIDLLYPALCLHCKASLSSHVKHLCSDCQGLLELIEVSRRCPLCFASDYCPTLHACGGCKKTRSLLTAAGSAFDHIGPAATLVQQMKYGGQRHLAKGAAAYLAIQFLTLQWPLPDLIVPVPISSVRHFERGYNQSYELALGLADFLKRPAINALKRRSGGYSQAGLTRSLRLELNADSFQVKKSIDLQDKIVLLIDDVTTTGSTLNCCAEALQEHCPQAIYALTLCRAAK